MAAKYARAAGGNWSADATWSTTSGGAADTTAPTAADDVFLNASSGAVTIDAGAERSCRSINCTGYTNTLTHAASTVLNIGDASAGASNVALKFVAAMTYTLGNAVSSSIEFESTSATVQTIDFAGKTTASIAFNGGGASTCSYQYTGQHVTGATATVYLIRGTLDINGQTCSWGKFDSNNTNTRSLTLGAATITITGAGTAFTIANTSGLTTSMASSTINFTGASPTLEPSGTFGTINVTGGGTFIWGALALACTNFTFTGTAAKTDSISPTGGITCSGTLTINGNSSINRVLVKSNTVGTAKTFTAATVTVSNTDFQDITGAGAGSWDFSARTDIGNCGGNSGITFPASVAQYYGGVNLNGSYLRCNGIASNYVSAPDSAPLSITGDLTIDCKVLLDDWTPTAAVILWSKYLASGNQRSYWLFVDTTGKLIYRSSVDGAATTINSTSSVATGVTDGAIKWIRVTHDVDNGSGGSDVKFYTSDDGSSWSQLGTTQTTGSTTSIYNSTAPLSIGSLDNGASNNLIGNYYNLRIYSDITQTNKVFDADFTAQAAGTKSFTESSANAATVSLVVTGGNWSASSWTTRVPLPQDDCYMGNAYAASQTVTADMPRLGRSIDWTGATGSPTFSLNVSASIYFFGSLTLISGMTPSVAAGNAVFAGRGNYTITSSGKNWSTDFNVNAPTGTYTLQDAFSASTKTLTITNGTFNANNFAVTVGIMNSNFSSTRGLTMGTGVWTINTTSGVTAWDISTVTGMTFSGADSVITFATSSNGRNFATGALTYGTLNYVVSGSTGQLKIQGGNPSFNVFNFYDASNARTLVIDVSRTLYIRSANGFNVYGSAGKLITINSGAAATHTVSSPNKQVCSYLNVDYSVATGGGAWYAQSTSTDGGHNTGWIFTDAPADTVFPSNSGLVSLRNLQNLQKL